MTTSEQPTKDGDDLLPIQELLQQLKRHAAQISGDRREVLAIMLQKYIASGDASWHKPIEALVSGQD